MHQLKPFNTCLHIFIGLCFCALVCPVAAQTYTSKHLQQITERDGLPSNSIYTLMLDDLGRVWIGCPNGLSVYDGYGFKKMLSNPNDTTVIRGTIAYAMMKEDDGGIWVGTNPAYLEHYDPVTGHFTHQGFESMVLRSDTSLSFLGFITSDIVKDARGNIYAGVSAFADVLSGLMVRVKGEDSFTLVNPLPGDSIGNVFRMRADRRGQVWLVSNGGVYRIDERRQLHNEEALFKNISWRSGETVNDFLFDADNKLWLLTNLGGLVGFDVERKIFTRYQYASSQQGVTDFGNCIALHPGGNLWIGTSGGIKVFSPKTQSFRAFDYSSHPHLAKTLITTIIFNKHGEAFIGTSNIGLMRYAEKPGFKSLTTDPEVPNGLPPGWVDRMVQAQDGRIWVHAQNNMVALDPGTYAITLKTNRPTFNRAVTAFWQTAPNNWITTISDGTMYAASEPTAPGQKILPAGLPPTLHVRNRMLDSRGNEWLVTLQGLYRKTPDAGTYKHYDLSKAAGAWRTSNTISVIVESRKHNSIWIGGDVGLYQYHYQGDSISRHLYDVKKGPVLVQQDVNSLYEDNEGILWIGQWQGGLSRYNPSTGEVKHYNINDGLPDMAVQAIAGDKYGMLWLSTFNGLSRFNPRAEVFNNFTLDDGLQSSQFADGSVLNAKNGDILFGGSNGLTIVHPEDFTGDYHAPDVYITDVRVFGKALNEIIDQPLKQPIYATQKIELQHSDNNFAFDFVAIHYSNPTRNRYAVIMENYDDEWRQLGNQRRAFYPNLPPGKYVFRVKASNDRGIWNETGASLEIVILPPWWRTWWAYLLYGVLLVFAGVVVHRTFRAYAVRKERERAQQRELEQKREIEKAYTELGQAHAALQAAQNQLVQSEKMAALGELTAGIAHEIQNPLNFVNNFSEVSNELITEMKNEFKKGDVDEGFAIAGDIQLNLEKILHHGKRADAIVKGMLQHSSASSGKKEPTNINALADEYLRLAYHGLRAKDKSFNPTLKTDFDKTIGNINIVPQDIGRVVLNLINNAFYAVDEKRKLGVADYEPTVIVSSKKVGNKVLIAVKDNGNGIPQAVLDKIFQPFFTTKPTGQGTGLGLSLSYDIVKAHGGEIQVNSRVNEGTEFTIQLPL